MVRHGIPGAVPLRVGLLLALVATPLVAQRTWIVDAANAPGTDFLDLPPAVAAAQAGDRILMRAGMYQGATIRHALRIVGEPGARLGFVDQLVVEQLPAVETVEVTGLGFENLFGPGLMVRDNLGVVTMHDIQIGSSAITTTIELVDNRYVALSGDLPPVEAESSLLSIDSALIRAGTPFQAGVRLDGCQAFLSDLDVTGGAGSPSGNPLAGWPGVGIDAVQNTVLHISGTVIARGGSPNGHPSRTAPGLALRDSTAFVDPGATFVGSQGPATFLSNSQLIQQTVAGLAVSGGSIGGTLQIVMSAPAGLPATLVASGAAAPIALPFGTLIVDAVTAVSVAVGSTTSPGLVSPLLAVPADPGLAGTQLHFQGAFLQPALTLSNPASVVLR